MQPVKARPRKVKLFHIHHPLKYSGEMLEISSNLLRFNHYYCISSKNRTDKSYEVYDNRMKKYFKLLQKLMYCPSVFEKILLIHLSV